MKTTVILVPEDGEGTFRWCGHGHGDQVAAERCLRRVERRWPSLVGRVVLADSLRRSDYAYVRPTEAVG
jgi:hypothetical protein